MTESKTTRDLIVRLVSLSFRLADNEKDANLVTEAAKELERLRDIIRTRHYEDINE